MVEQRRSVFAEGTKENLSKIQDGRILKRTENLCYKKVKKGMEKNELK